MFAEYDVMYNTLRSVVLALCILSVAESALARNLTVDEARNLVAIALGENVSSLPHFGLAYEIVQNAPGFYMFEATAEIPNNPDASPVIGHYGVNQATGDVGEEIACEKITSAPLARAQAAIRKAIKISREQLRLLTAKAPCQP
jgi:hypothetical protein